MNIIYLPNKKLRQKSQLVNFPLSLEDQKIIQVMIDYIDKSQNKNNKLREGIGIAAVQIGYLKKMFYVNVPKSEYNEHFREFLINPKIVAHSQYLAALEKGEGCLSINPDKDDQEGLVHRYFKIVIQGYSYFSKEKVEYRLTGILAIVAQHEMDHLEGKLYIDRIDDKNKWQALENEELF